MTKRRPSLVARFALLALATQLLPVFSAGASPALPPAGGDALERAVEQLDALPMAFEPNRGQTDERVDYVARGRGYGVYLAGGSATLALSISRPTGASRDERASAREKVALRLSLAGADEGATPVAGAQLPGRASYLTGSDRSKWLRDLPTFEKVRYPRVYDGVDVVYYGSQQRLEYDFLVAPNADPSQIRVRFDGASSVEVDAEGALVVGVGRAKLRQPRPVAYEGEGSARREVAVGYAVAGDGSVGFEIGDRDASLPLTIDPVIRYESFLGGSASDDEAFGIAVDAAGAAYVVGQTTATDFPTTPGAYDTTYNPAPDESGRLDGFVTKLAANGGSVLFSTYIGGTDADTVDEVVVTASGIFLAGDAESRDFPTTPGAFDTSGDGGTLPGAMRDGFVAKLALDGASLVYSTYLGSTGGELVHGLDVTAAGEAVVTGRTSSTDFPTTAGAFDTTFNGGTNGYDAFVTKVSASGASLVYSTFVGGSADDEGFGVALGGDGTAYVAGRTASSGFPTTVGAFDTTSNGAGTDDAFALALAPSGASLVYSTFLGGSANDAAHDVVVDASGNAYVAGETASTDYPVAGGGFTTGSTGCFVTKVAPTGASLVYSSRFGGSGTEEVHSIALGSGGVAFVAGSASDATFPTTGGAFDTTYGGGADAFALALAANGQSLVYSTFLGGGALERARAIAVDGAGAAYVAGATASSAYPTVAGAYDTTYNGKLDAFVTKIASSGATLVYSTFLGGQASTTGSLADFAQEVAVDASGNAYVTGQTLALNFPSTPGTVDPTHQVEQIDDVFVAKIAANGASLVYATFLGGSEDDAGLAIAVDASGSAYVTGRTGSADFPTTVGAFDRTFNSADPLDPDVFVAKLSASGASLVYSTFVGGATYDQSNAIALGGDGSAYVAGLTDSSGYPTTAGAFDTTHNGGGNDAFVTRLNASGSALVYSTFLGGASSDNANGIVVDASGAAYAVGSTPSSAFPTTGGAFDTTANGSTDAWVTKIASTGASLVYSTFLGGTGSDVANGVAIDGSGAAYVTGETTSTGYPTTAGAFDTTLGNGVGAVSDAFVTKIASTGASLVYSTFLGGAGADSGLDVAIDSTGRAFVTGTTASTGFPTTVGTYDATLNDGVATTPTDAFVTAVAATGASLSYSTYLGGSALDVGRAIAVDPAGLVYVVGNTESPDFAVTGFGARDGLNGFVVKLDPVPIYTYDTVGVYVSATGAWFLRNADDSGNADLVFTYGGGGPNLVPLSGDWDGDGIETPGLYDSTTGAFFLRNSSSAGPADIVFTFGPGGAGIVPLIGDWDGDLVDTIGLYNTATGAFFLRNSNTSGGANTAFTFGAGGNVPITGDWDGDFVDTIGLYAPGTGAFFLRNTNMSGPADVVFTYGPANLRPVVGDYDGDLTDTVGVYDPATGAWFLRNANGPGPAESVFTYGPANATPLVGNWDGQ